MVLCAAVNFDARNNVGLLQDLDEGHAAPGGLANRFIEENRAADAFAQIRRGDD
ncbi:hypothetical protein D3C83_287370 [compost metagenome]